MLKVLLITIVLVLFSGCDEELIEDTEEQLCTEASGDWSLTSATCDGNVQTLDPVTINIDHTAGSIAYTQGAADCTSTTTYTSIFNTEAEVELVGSGNLTCSQNGSSTSSCTGTSTNCDETTSINAIVNNYSLCVLANETSVTLKRTVTAQQVADNVTYCTEGQEEVLSFALPSPATTAILAISDGPTHDFENAVVNASMQKIFTVTNSGDGDASSLEATLLLAPFSFLDGTFPGTGGTCTVTLAASENCTIVVDFSPTTIGVFSSSIELSYYDGTETQNTSRTIQGTGAQPALLTISDGPLYDYANIVVGNNDNKTFTITNSGGVEAIAVEEGTSLSLPFAFSDGNYPGSGGDCSLTLAPGASCNIEVRYSPTATVLSMDTIEVRYNDGNSLQTVTRDIQGTGI